MKKCSFIECERNATQKFMVPAAPENSPYICTEMTYYSGDNPMCYQIPGPPRWVCAEHYDELIEWYRTMSEQPDHPEAKVFEEIVKLNS